MPALRLLIVDDEPALGGFAAHVGRRVGFDVAVALDAEGFKEAYLHLLPDVVIVDLGMPGGDGDEILHFLALRRCTAPVLIISGAAPSRLDASRRLGEGLGLNMLDPLAKPVRLGDLQDLLASLQSARGRPDAAPRRDSGLQLAGEDRGWNLVPAFAGPQPCRPSHSIPGLAEIFGLAPPMRESLAR